MLLHCMNDIIKIALIGDIHANLAALQAVLQHAARRKATEIWNVGDSVGYGPFPGEVLQLLRQARILSIAGNCDIKTLRAARRATPPGRRPEKHMAFAWTRRQLTAANLAFLASLPRQRRLRRGGRRILLTHGSPFSIKEYLDGDTPAPRLRAVARAARAELLVCGHAHRPFKQKTAGVWIVNTGSVGRPDDGDRRACYAMLEISPRRMRIRHYRVAYDLAHTLQALRRRRLPESFARMFAHGLDFEQAAGKQKKRS